MKINFLPVDDAEVAELVVASRDKMDRSLNCKRWATGGMRAKVAGKRATSDFMSESNSSS
jgi:hypothetical protein